MHNRFVQTINDMWGLIGKRSTLLAVSGGIDSMCMADLFVSCFSGEHLALAHCNFNLRSDESDGDEALVRTWADAHGVPCHVMSFDTRSYASENGISIEMAARELRYKWFAELCSSYGYESVAVAHNANDNAETLMLNILRGSGMKGLGGMSLMSDLPYHVPSSSCGTLYLLRPMLGFTRKQIEGHVYAHRIPYRDDSSNFSSEYKRNMLRNEVFPVFERINPSAVRTINRDMTYFSEAGSIVEEWCSENARKVCDIRLDSGPVLCRIDLPSLLSIPHWKYLLYHILEKFGFNSASMASLEDLLVSGRTLSGKRFESGEYVLVTERDSLVVIREEIVSTPDVVMTVRGAGTYHFNGSAFDVEVVPWSEGMPLKQPEGVLIFDAAKLRFPFVLRSWRNGDWFIPFGMKGKKKVSDLFTDLKYDSFMKASAVVISDVQTPGMADSRHVAGVAGVRADNLYKVTSSTSSVVRISSSLTRQ